MYWIICLFFLIIGLFKLFLVLFIASVNPCFACFQVVGNLIYYRYMNPAIVAPDAFDIVDLSIDRGLTSDQVSISLPAGFLAKISNAGS